MFHHSTDTLHNSRDPVDRHSRPAVTFPLFFLLSFFCTENSTGSFLCGALGIQSVIHNACLHTNQIRQSYLKCTSRASAPRRECDNRTKAICIIFRTLSPMTLLSFVCHFHRSTYRKHCQGNRCRSEARPGIHCSTRRIFDSLIQFIIDFNQIEINQLCKLVIWFLQLAFAVYASVVVIHAVNFTAGQMIVREEMLWMSFPHFQNIYPISSFCVPCSLCLSLYVCLDLAHFNLHRLFHFAPKPFIKYS